MKKIVMDSEDRTVTVKNTKEKREHVFNAIVKWFKEHDQFSGEGIQQSDDCNISATDLLSTIVDDIIKFKEVYKDDEE